MIAGRSMLQNLRQQKNPGGSIRLHHEVGPKQPLLGSGMLCATAVGWLRP